MKFCSWGKDGGSESTVSGFWLVELKNLFSVVLLKFEGKSRNAFHNHAFNSISWLLSGELHEYYASNPTRNCPSNTYWFRFSPIITRRDTFHKVDSNGTSWVLSFRGPWAKTWQDMPEGEAAQTLTWGRQAV